MKCKSSEESIPSLKVENMKFKSVFVAAPLGLTVLAGCNSRPQQQLVVTYGSSGLDKIVYRGVLLEDVKQYPADAFMIGHMKMTDMAGNVKTEPDYGWGENNTGKKWNEAEKAWDYSYPWGSIRVQYVQDNNVLNVNVTETNRADSGAIFDGATVVPFVLHFGQIPDDFPAGPFPALSDNYTSPGVVVADYGTARAALVVPDAGKPLYAAYRRLTDADAFAALVSSTSPDDLSKLERHMDRPVMPGQTDRFTLSLRFFDDKQPIQTVAADAYNSWNQRWPSTLDWKDRRPIGALYLASSPSAGTLSDPANPRRYFELGTLSGVDIRTPDGLAKFQQRVLSAAGSVVETLRRLDAQGAVTWDIEGEQYPQETSYVCSPDQIATIAPEMESKLPASSPYPGMKLDDAYFKIIRNGGFRVGVCVRPQQFTQRNGPAAEQVELADDRVANELLRKVKFAHDRWGATLFYLGSTVGSKGDVIDPAIVQTVSRAFPDSLMIPQETTPRYYGFSAGFRSFLWHGDTGTPAAIYNYYPHAFSVNMINDASPDKLRAARQQLTDATRRGDILMVLGAFWHANNSVVQDIYSEAATKENSTRASIAP
jgi:hypothetical protein